MTETIKGTCKWFNSSKGYGFIVPETGGSDIFVHISDLEKAGIRSLSEGQSVQFEIGEDRGKRKATNIKAA